MRIDRLKHLITILQTVPARQFNLHTWQNECGTTACAVGWAARDPLFNQQGLTLGLPDGYGYTRPVPIYLDHTNWYAVYDFFHLTADQADHLFNDEYYDFEPGRRATPADVIERIEALINGATP